MCFWFAIQCLVCKPFSISEPAKHVLHTICSTRLETRLIVMFRFKRSTSVAHTAHFCSCWDCLVRTSASCFSFFGTALSLPMFQQSLSFHHPLFNTLRYAEHSVLQCLLLQSFVFAQDIPFAEFAFTSMHKHPFYATLQKQGPPKITGKHAKMS